MGQNGIFRDMSGRRLQKWKGHIPRRTHDFPRLSPGFIPKFKGSASGALGHQAPGAGHQTLDAWILSAQRPLTRCSLTPEPPRRLDYSRQSVSSCTQTLVNLVFTGLYRDTPRSPCTSVIASSSDMLKTRLRGGADVKTPGNRADDSVTRWIFPRTCLFPSLTETCCLAWIIARSGSDLGAQPRHLRAVHVSHDLW